MKPPEEKIKIQGPVGILKSPLFKGYHLLLIPCCSPAGALLLHCSLMTPKASFAGCGRFFSFVLVSSSRPL
jgi:hypothetical protein